MVIAAPQVRAPANPAGQDRYAPAQARKERTDLEQMPGLQTLPYSGRGVRIELVDVARDERLVLRVVGTGERQARRGYRRWLRRFGDSGRRYLPLFRWTAGQRSSGARG
ncbi:hypothetical protein GKE82_24990 [Conexibacter sp. W3-3-2]|uniref:hypothetical protein n=1 Tax=Conexibacter sp. W3-3-2 TaxID=2675227 RepID=UPI0012B84BAF|nr:hypothetical protein [Conexibacter sp. W3-3-2]MTD47462.1 hypothetical protein [Conexibacter sp. W3-3-2]